MAQTLVFLTSVPVAYERKDHFDANQLLNLGFDFDCLLDSGSSLNASCLMIYSGQCSEK